MSWDKKKLENALDILGDEFAGIASRSGAPIVAIALIGVLDDGVMMSHVIERSPSQEALRAAFRELGEDMGEDVGTFNAGANPDA